MNRKWKLLNEDFAIWMWNVATGEEVRRFLGHEGPVAGLEFLPDGKRLLSVSSDLTMRLWDITTGKELHRDREPCPIGPYDGQSFVVGKYYAPNAPPTMGIAVSADGHLALVNGQLWDIGGWKLIHKFGPIKVNGSYTGAWEGAFSPDGKSVICGYENGTIRMFDTASGKELLSILGSRNKTAIHSVAVSPDGQWLLSGGVGTLPGFAAMAAKLPAMDCYVRLWRIRWGGTTDGADPQSSLRAGGHESEKGTF